VVSLSKAASQAPSTTPPGLVSVTGAKQAKQAVLLTAAELPVVEAALLLLVAGTVGGTASAPDPLRAVVVKHTDWRRAGWARQHEVVSAPRTVTTDADPPGGGGLAVTAQHDGKELHFNHVGADHVQDVSHAQLADP